MRRIRKITSNDKRVPVPKENKELHPTVIKKGSLNNKVGRITISPSNIPTVQSRPVNVLMNEHPYVKRPISKIEPIWIGETIFIIGGGTSLRDFNWASLNGKKTIAINKSIISYPNANILYWTDSRVYSWLKQDIDNFNGLKYTIRDHHSYVGDIKILKKVNKFNLEESKDTLSHGNNSGYAAINLAYHLGAKRIILLGYDMRNDGKKSHYHDGYPVPITGDNIYRDEFIPGFQVLAHLLKTKGVEVYNASLNSLLTVWPKITIDKALTFG